MDVDLFMCSDISEQQCRTSRIEDVHFKGGGGESQATGVQREANVSGLSLTTIPWCGVCIRLGALTEKLLQSTAHRI
jgi:hypothetical protein